MKRKTIYLAGLISTDYPESLLWRIEVTPILEAHEFDVLSPMRGKENLALESPDGGITDPNLTSKDIILRDYHDVVASDVILMHLESFGSPRPLLGTICELAWAWEMKKPIIAVVHPANKLMLNHPFVKEAVSHYLNTTEEAVEFIAHHFGSPKRSAAFIN
jgi:nucleoside 2-deoxyribosyltransferase